MARRLSRLNQSAAERRRRPRFNRNAFRWGVNMLVAAMAARLDAGEARAQTPDASNAIVPARVDATDDPLPGGALLRLGSLRFRHPSTVVDIALSPDEKTVVTIGAHGGPLIAWDAATGQERWRDEAGRTRIDIPAASYGTRAIVFAPEGQRFYAPGGGNSILAWGALTGASESISVGPPVAALLRNVGIGDVASYRSIDVSHDGRMLAVGNSHGLTVCDEAGKVLYSILNAPDAPVDADGMNRDRLLFGGHYSYARFSPDGNLLAVVTSDAPEEIKLFDAELGQEIRRIALNARLVRMEFSPDGKRLATTERDNSARMYETESGDRIWSHTVDLRNPYENYTSAIAFAPGGERVAIAATDKLLRLLDTTTGHETATLAGHGWYPWALAFNRDGSMLYSSGWDGAVRRWDVATRKQLPLPVGVRATGVVCLSPDGRWLAYEDDAGTVRLVDAADGRELGQFGVAGARYSQLAFSPDSRRLAGGGAIGDQVHVAVWDRETGQSLNRWEWPKGRDPNSRVEALGFTPDGRRLAAAVFRQSMAYLWDLSGNRQIAQLPHGEAYGLSFSPDGQTLATVGWDSILRLWSTKSGKQQREILVKQHIGDVAARPGARAPRIAADGGPDLRMYAVSYAPVGGLAATQHMDGDVWIWDAQEWKVRQTIRVGESFGYGSLALSPGGLWAATGSSSGHITVWDASTAQKVWESNVHQDHVYTLSFGGGSRFLASGGDDGVCYLWDLRQPPPGVFGDRQLLTEFGLPRLPAGVDDDAEGLWSALAGDDSAAAFYAFHALVDRPDAAVAVVAEKLQDVDSLMDPDARDEGISNEEASRRQRLTRMLIARDPSVERTVTAKRAVALLYQLNTPRAIEALRELAAKGPDNELAVMAADALARVEGRATP